MKYLSTYHIFEANDFLTKKIAVLSLPEDVLRQIFCDYVFFDKEEDRIYQLDELSKLIDRAGTLSAKDRALLVAKASAIYTNLPKLVGQLTSSDQRKLWNYSGEFANYLKRNAATANP